MENMLFSPYTIKNITIPNRIVMSPMCMYSADTAGFVQPFHLTHYTSRAVGQAGLIMLEATAVTPEGRISDNDLGIWSDEHIDGLSRIVNEVKQYGSKTAIQLAHAGRKSTAKDTPIAPTSLAFDETMRVPEEMSRDQIKSIISAFQHGALRAKKAGFDLVEIHGAHGYLINQFLTPLINKREDEYGGSLENRYRFLREVITAVQEVWDGPLLVRISANEYHEAGNTIEDFIQFAAWMKEQGVDLVDISSGGVVPARINTYPGYQVTYAEAIKKGADIPTGTVGLITTGIQAEEILQNGRADLIFIARALLRNPYWALQAANELGVTLEAPKQYSRGW